MNLFTRLNSSVFVDKEKRSSKSGKFAKELAGFDWMKNATSAVQVDVWTWFVSVLEEYSYKVIGTDKSLWPHFPFVDDQEKAEVVVVGKAQDVHDIIFDKLVNYMTVGAVSLSVSFLMCWAVFLGVSDV